MLSVLRNRYLWFGLVGLFLLALVLYLLFNQLLMPAYTRHGVAVQVPQVVNLPADEARQILRSRDLRVQEEVQRYNPSFDKGVVVDQNPPANAQVKPGRRVYIYVNSDEVPTVEVPDVTTASLRQARSHLLTRGLEVGEVSQDTLPSQFKNTITRQEPAAGTRVPEGTRVDLWVSSGLGESYVLVPDLVGLTVPEAQRMLQEGRLSSIVLVDSLDAGATGEVSRQSPAAGTSVREGYEVRVYTHR